MVWLLLTASASSAVQDFGLGVVRVGIAASIISLASKPWKVWGDELVEAYG
jgi:hypothetical protein